MRNRIVLALVSSLIFAASSSAADRYVPDRIGLTLGMSELELLQNLIDQGFAVNQDIPGKERIGLSAMQSELYDRAFVVSEASGSLDIWSSIGAILFTKDGELTGIMEAQRFPKAEAETIYQELESTYNDEFEAEGQITVSISAMPADFISALQQITGTSFENKTMGKRGVDYATEHEAAAWSDGNGLVRISLTADHNASGKNILKNRRVYVAYLLVCDLPPTVVRRLDFECGN